MRNTRVFLSACVVAVLLSSPAVPADTNSQANKNESGDETTPVNKNVSGKPRVAEFKIATRKREDRVDVTAKGGRTVFTVSSPSGIGGAVIDRVADRWPKSVVIRLHLRGLESFTVRLETVRLSVSVLSHSSNKRLLHLWRGPKEGPQLKEASPYWTDVRTCDAKGKPIQGLPPRGGYFEITLPKVMLKGNPKSITLGWIDFYRM